MLVKQKTHIKHLFASKPYKKHGTIDLAILTDANQYIECSLDFKSSSLTKWVSKRIRSLFEPYLIDKNSDIMVNELLDEDHPMYQYFMLLRQHIGFKLSTAGIDRVVSRINYYYTRKAATKSKLNKIWQRVIDEKQCPWITQDVEYALQNKGAATSRRIKIVRLTMFYIVVKNYIGRIVGKSKSKRMA